MDDVTNEVPIEVIKPSKKSEPKKFTPEEVQKANRVITQIYYRLKFRTPAGSIRGDINKETVRELSVNWGDLLRIIPNHRWSTFEEILNMAWEFERRSIRKMYTRTRKQVEEGVAKLLECGVLEQKE